MRLSDYLGLTVRDRLGKRLGHVHDAELVPDGPPAADFGNALRVHALLVGRSAIGVRLGLDRPQMRGPLPFKVFFGRRTLQRVAWEQIDEIRGDELWLRLSEQELRSLESNAAR